ncbi:MAG: PDZ domain-containing protein [Chloroflexi bacterium]|nr:MAG: PDZ domain-containing protein [Chloroflexota bacterium]
MLPGDILLALDGTPLTEVEALQKSLSPERVGQSVKARVVRGGEVREVTVRVGSR